MKDFAREIVQQMFTALAKAASLDVMMLFSRSRRQLITVLSVRSLTSVILFQWQCLSHHHVTLSTFIRVTEIGICGIYRGTISKEIAAAVVGKIKNPVFETGFFYIFD